MKIKEIVKVNSLESHYVSQKIDGLINSIEKGGLKEPVVINLLNELIHGYNRVAACEQLGYTDIEVVIEDVESSLFEYTTRNIHRTKTTEDLIKDIEVVLEKFPRKQGKRHTGTPYVRHEEIIKGLNYKYKDEETIRHLEFVMNNDFVGKNLMKSHLNNNEALSACVEFIKTNRKIDLDNNYGFTKKVLDGTMLVKDANKLIQKRFHLENNDGSFILPNKCYAYQMDCTKITEIPEYLNIVDLLFSSIPYYQLRNYDSLQIVQLGHEQTKELFCENISLIFKKLIPTLKTSANVLINVGETYRNGLALGIPQLIKYYIEKNTNLIYKETIIWQKTNPGYHREHDEKRPINCTEVILWFVVDPTLSKYNLITYKKENNHSKIEKPKDKEYSSFWNFIEEQKVINVLKTCAGKNHELYKIYEEGHPALMYRLLPLVPILMCSDEGDVVFDPFSGAGTVGKMAALLNRKSLTTEISKLYFSLGCEYMKLGFKQFNREGLDAIQHRFYDSNISIQINEAA